MTISDLCIVISSIISIVIVFFEHRKPKDIIIKIDGSNNKIVINKSC